MEKMVNRSHVLVVPLPGAGHINPMLQFSRRLVSKGLKVTFVITEFISKSRQLGSSIGSIQLDTISDGYDDGFNQAGSREPYLSSLHDVGPKTLSDLIKRYQTSSIPIHAVIYEPFLAWALDVAKDFGLFAAAFFTHACAVDYIFYNVYHEVLKMPVSSTPVLIEGLPLLLELQDLPTFVVLPDSYPANVKMIMSQFANLDKADWILINTFYKLECEVGNFVPHNWTLQLFVLPFQFLGKSHSFSISIPNQLISSIPSQSYLRQFVPPFKNCNVLFSFVSFGYWRRQIYIV
jgi:pathogen-inducible salicylic acid glucosyltransferase